MTMQPENLTHLERWIEKAEHDLINAEHTLSMDDAVCPYDTVCFHAQQCTEKYLKAYLIGKNTDFPNTHDLVVLLNLVRKAGESGLEPDDVRILNRYSVESRYPGDWEPIGRQEAEEALTVAKKIRDAVRTILPGK